MNTQTLKLTNDISELDKLAPFIESLEETLDIPADLIFKVNLALDEMVTNSVSYAYPGETGRPVTLVATKTDTALICEIIDEGKPFNPLEQAPEVDTTLSVEERQIGGLGIFISQNVTDKMEYKRRDGHNILSLTFNIAE